MKRTMTIILLGLFAAFSAFAQESKPKMEDKPAGEMKAKGSMPAVDQILDKYVKAIGGKAAIEKHTSRVMRGTIDIPAAGVSGSAEIYAKAPDKSLAVITIAGYGAVQEGFDGTVAWSDTPETGLREKSGAELAATKLDAHFYRDLNLKKLYPKMELKGEDKVGERAAYVIEATPAGADPEKWYFDAESGLLLRMDMEREGPTGKLPVEVYFDNYKEVDGVKLPSSIRQVTPAFTINLMIDKITHGEAIDDAKFKKPGGQ
ncbi:MAG: hypothetical protein L0229_10405 [Blastocatellia bacterium]|nr:hypothetical protein [Blastocatellia bacterium]